MLETIFLLKGTNFTYKQFEAFANAINKHYPLDTSLTLQIPEKGDLLIYGNGPQLASLKGKTKIDLIIELLKSCSKDERKHIYAEMIKSELDK